MKFEIRTWQSSDGKFSAACVEKQTLLGPRSGFAIYNKTLRGFATREDALEAIKKVIDDFLRPHRTTVKHGVYP